MTRQPPKKTPRPKSPGKTRAGDAAPNDGKPASGTGEVEELGGRDGPDPTRYGDWEYKGRCIDF